MRRGVIERFAAITFTVGLAACAPSTEQARQTEDPQAYLGQGAVPAPVPAPTAAPETAAAPPVTAAALGNTIAAGDPNMPCAPGEQIDYVITNAPIVAITIDDGPSLETTRQLMQVFSNHRAHGTFFFLGNQLEHPEGQAMAREVLAAGHEIGLHSYSHTLKDPDVNAAEHERAVASIKNAIGFLPYAYRPPGLLHTPSLLKAVKDSGQCLVERGVAGDTFDWKSDREPPGEARANILKRDEKVLKNIKPGTFILMHEPMQEGSLDGGDKHERPFGPDELDFLLAGLEAKGLTSVTMTTALRSGQHIKEDG